MTNRNARRQKTGFTLIELMIVIVILGLLATVIMPKILDRPEQARRTKAMLDIKSIETALASFKIDTGWLPTTAQGLAALVSNPGVENYHSGGYLEKMPTDPWGNQYIYVSPSQHGNKYDLESYGRDGEDGGADDDADIESWNLN